MDDLSGTLKRGRVRLEPLAENHLSALKDACAEDTEIWQIYPVNMLDDGFDTAMELFHSLDNWVRFAVIDAEQSRVVGMTNYINPDPFGIVEIGGTYITPFVRGSGFNSDMKALMINHAFACGYRKIRFNIDTRNTRSMAAVEKLGAVREGTLRKDRITWTGYIRDTAIYGLLKNEWAG